MSTYLSTQRVIISLVMLLLFAGGTIYINSQAAHAIVQNPYAAKVSIEKHTIKRGQTQTIEAQVKSKSGAPLTGTIVAFNINYADLVTTRQASVAVDSSGHASYSWTIGKNVKPGNFDVNFVVSGPGFKSQSFSGQSFVVQKAAISTNRPGTQ